MIITWNIVRYQRLRKEVKKNLENDIINAYNECKPELEILSSVRLEDLNDPMLEKIKHVFSVFSSKQSLEFTGGSKVLHIISPNVFMMWDNSIKEAYHRLHANRDHGIEECYVEFMKQSREIIKALLYTTTENELWEKHLAFVDKGFVQAFSFRESVTKMLDECNYIKFFKKIEF